VLVLAWAGAGAAAALLGFHAYLNRYHWLMVSRRTRLARIAGRSRWPAVAVGTVVAGGAAYLARVVHYRGFTEGAALQAVVAAVVFGSILAAWVVVTDAARRSTRADLADAELAATVVGTRMHSRRLARRLNAAVWVFASGAWVAGVASALTLPGLVRPGTSVRWPLVLGAAALFGMVAFEALRTCLYAVATATRATVVVADGTVIAEGRIRGRVVGRVAVPADAVETVEVTVCGASARGTGIVARTEVVLVCRGGRRVPVAYTEREAEGRILWDWVDLAVMTVAEAWAGEIGAGFRVTESPRNILVPGRAEHLLGTGTAADADAA